LPVCTWALLAYTPSAAAQSGSVSGIITDASTGDPLAAAQVYVSGTAIGRLTDETGQYVLSGVPAGTVTVRADLIGYRGVESQVTVIAGGTADLDLSLEPTVVALDNIVVTGDGLPGFPWRTVLLFAAVFLPLELRRGPTSSRSDKVERKDLVRICLSVAVASILLAIPTWIQYGVYDVQDVLYFVMDITWWFGTAAVALAAVGAFRRGSPSMPWRRAILRGAVASLFASLLWTFVQHVVLELGWYVVGFVQAAGNGAIVGIFIALHQTLAPPYGHGRTDPMAALS
jgi:hypothetical protein